MSDQKRQVVFDIRGKVESAEVMSPIRAVVGMAFTPHGTDSVGRVAYVSPSTIAYAYDHAPEVRWTLPRESFTTWFAEVVPA